MTARKRRPRTAKSVYGTRAVVQKNQQQISLVHDSYHWLLTTGRINFGLTILGAYLGANLLFALLYMACGGIENARPGSLLDAFFFSVQTMATIGYGRMVPISTAANLLVTIEAGLGLFGIAVAASLLFARFTRASAGIRFSVNAVVTKFDGKPTLMFRLANERSVRINQAHVFLVLARQETTSEGKIYRRLHDLQTLRSFSPVFELSWTVMHVIDETSPLHGSTPEDLIANEAALTVVFTGHHEGFQQQVHDRHTYPNDKILWNHNFADLIERDADGGVTIDFAQFDVVTPVAAKEKLKRC
jgi:inward rectifier potassium channel